MDREQLKKQWSERASKLLVGRKIKSVSYMTPKEESDAGWDRAPLVIELDNDVVIFASSDDEGNGAGALFTSSEKQPCFPVI